MVRHVQGDSHLRKWMQPDGRVTASCAMHRRPPWPGCGCGISFMTSAERMTWLFGDQPETPTYAVTFGKTIGRVLMDGIEPNADRYGYYVASGYQATAILTPNTDRLNFEIPCIRGYLTRENISALQHNRIHR